MLNMQPELNFGLGNPCPKFVQQPLKLKGQRVVSVWLVYLVYIYFYTVTSLGPQFVKCPALYIIVSGMEVSIKIILIWI